MKYQNVFSCLLFCLLFSLNLSAQSKIEVSGTVKEKGNGMPIPGVNVLVKTQNEGTDTDFDGKFTISVNPDDVLEFSYIGMKTVEVKVDGRTTINVEMSEETTELKEVVVIGYGSANKRDLTGSIESVKAEDIANRPSSNPLASIQGKVAGVQIVNSGRAGQNPDIRVRGTNSINGYKPLYVVDGLFTDNIDHLNPEDIESMEILKDPSSLAIFGVRGANGVIIVNTKKSQEGKTRINFNSSLGLKTVVDRIKIANAAEFKELYAEQLQNQNKSPFDFSGWNNNTDWQDEIFQQGWVINNNISIAGANDKSEFYMGFGYIKEDGAIKSEEMQKMTLTLNSKYNVTDNLRFGFQVNGSRTLPVDAKGVSKAIKAAPIAPVYSPDGKFYHTMPDFQRAQVSNPMIDIEYLGNHNKATNHRVSGNIFGELDFWNDFSFKTTLSMNYFVAESRRFSPIVKIYNPDSADKFDISSQNETIRQAKGTGLTTQADYILNYNKQLGLHSLTATAGLTTNYIETSSLVGARTQNQQDIVFSIPNDNPDKWWLSSIGIQGATNGSEQNRRFTMSYLVRALYNYDTKYLFNASFRRDGSSVFHSIGNTWDNFYSFGAGWVVSKENFMKNQSFVNFLKLKGSWGILGSQNTGGNYYPTYPLLVSSGGTVFGDRVVTAYSPAYLVQDLGWEKTHAWEAGAEIRIFNNRLALNPTYYQKNTKDVIVQLSGFSGASNSLENLGEIQNKGWEFSGSWTDQIGTSGFNYSLSANITTVDNKVISLGRGADDALYNGNGGISRTVEGYPIAYFYGYKVAGVYQSDADINSSPVNELVTVAPGDLKFEDINGDGKITTADRTMIGNPTPDFTYGFSLNMDYKNFDFGVDFMGVYGNEIYRAWGESGHAQLNYPSNRLGRWHGEGTSNWEPILNPSRAINLFNSDYFIEDGSFFRIRNIQLGYSLSPKVLDQLKMDKFRVYVNIQNLKTWSNVSGYSPEVEGGGALSFGIDSGSYPLPIISTFGVNVTF